jgi:23S rRNA pseudouridine2605 synthase
MISERLQKFLANQGVGSRREVEKWIEQGRIKVNGQVAALGLKVSAEDRISIDGKFIQQSNTKFTPSPKVLMYNKPEGQLCTLNDPEGRRTVFESVPKLRVGRWIMVGRLDMNTMGLLLFTNHGELAHRLMHPSYEIEREYAVRVLGEVAPSALTKLRTGVQLEDGPAKFNTLQRVGGEGANQWFHVTLNEGRNREVRRMFEAVGLTVSRLIRVRYGTVTMPREISRGRWEYMEKQQVTALAKTVGLEFGKVKK